MRVGFAIPLAMLAILAILSVAISAATPARAQTGPSSVTEPTSVGKAANLVASTVGQDDGTVRLTWTGATDAQVHFLVYLKTSDLTARNFGQVRMVPFAGTEGVITGLEGGTQYSFIVTGMRWNWVNFGTIWGAWSDWQTATPRGTTADTGAALPVTEPTSVGKAANLVASTVGQDDGTVRLTWTGATDAQVHFLVYLKTSDLTARNFGQVRMVPFAGTEGVITGLEGGTQYSFIVTGMRWNWVNFGTIWGAWSDWQTATPQGSSAAMPPDRATLVSLYNATGGANWTNSANWLTDKPLDTWHGVTTDASGRVTELDLSENGLTGPIPPQLGSLTSLEELQLWKNDLTGPIPPELGSLANLKQLYIDGNGLTGVLPQELLRLTMLEEFGFFSNPGLCTPTDSAFQQWLQGIDDLYGSSSCDAVDSPEDRAILVSFFNATGGANWTDNSNWLSDRPMREWHGVATDASGRVIGLLFRGNNLSGEIPSSLGNLSELKALALHRNQLTGPIPTTLGNLSNLELLGLGGNQLNRLIPSQLGNLSNLETLYLWGNELTGPVPAWLGNLSNLKMLHLNSNQLTGPIPSQLGSLPNLEVLHLHRNQLTGTIPAQLGGLTSLENIESWRQPAERDNPVFPQRPGEFD